ncbi:MAG: prepilin-type N-terminal cleavage/methylation domain-containing protein [Saccharofermentans sp.]|nr:prepilin-type N-terminal cleavage/methylation domain-containing protein [Saccharofermentans sp.]
MRSLIKINKRSGSRKAFTLAELLIVVAIIGVLVGISIPIFMAQKEKSAEATDIANMRAAKAAASSSNGVMSTVSI